MKMVATAPILDPTLSGFFSTLPVSKRQLEGATSLPVFLRRTPIGELVSPDQLQHPSQRTKLLTPSVVICRYSRSRLLQRPSVNLRLPGGSVNADF